jgi:hypothetical protein
VTPRGIYPNNYLFAYSTVAQPITVANTFQNITYSTNGDLDGWSHTPGSSTFTCNQTGKYLIIYAAVASTNDNTDAVITFDFRLTQNGTEVTGSSLYLYEYDKLPIERAPVSTSVAISCTSGDTLSVQMRGINTLHSLKPGGIGTTPVSATITIIRIS